MRNINKLLIIILSVFIVTTVAAQAPINLHWAKAAVVKYYNTQQYQHEIHRVVDSAKQYLQQRVIENTKLTQSKKLAIVFDIDETALSNYPSMKKLQFGGSKKDLLQHMQQANDKAIKATYSLYKLAKKNDVSVFFITGRGEHLRKVTVKNLRVAGYTSWQKLYMRPDAYNQKSIVPYKSGARHAIESMNYDIIISIGDQHSDLKGGYADKTFKLPNPFYYIP